VSAPAPAATEFAKVDRRDPDLLKPPSGSFEARASLALKVVAFLAIGGVVLAQFAGTVPVALLFASTFSAAGAALSVIYAAVAFGIDRQRPWAVATIRPILAILPLEERVVPALLVDSRLLNSLKGRQTLAAAIMSIGLAGAAPNWRSIVVTCPRW
jgi:hypothetical protein